MCENIKKNIKEQGEINLTQPLNNNTTQKEYKRIWNFNNCMNIKMNSMNIKKPKASIILKIYERLLKEYGPQGWWPLIEESNKKNGDFILKYHPTDYKLPKTSMQQFEIIVGTILAQNTSWLQVEKALINLKKENLLSPKAILESDNARLKKAIRPAGYFNQKSERLKRISKWFLNKTGKPSREELLSKKGIGKETADSILLYAYKIPSFVVDVYTKRMLKNLKLISGKEKYDKIKEFFEENLPKDFKIYQEYHALIVAHAKQFYKKNKERSNDFLKELAEM